MSKKRPAKQEGPQRDNDPDISQAKKCFTEPKLTFIEPKLTKYGDITALTGFEGGGTVTEFSTGGDD